MDFISAKNSSLSPKMIGFLIFNSNYFLFIAAMNKLAC
uniref:Uncharacterized protein n=2 Tax=Vibrio TaxID=662 RepID=A0A0H3ZTF5_9VIBR|nr:hypothetical protein [Vibrio genomosp. F6]AKN37755.1 hypothetical protein [Vibrio tasmaniensis]AKN39628.1 hypothetical protein [Vibrio tasmaniensis]